MSTSSRITWPVAVVCPRCRKLRRRNSSGARPDGARDFVQVALEREDALRRAEAAERAVRRSVGGDGAGCGSARWDSRRDRRHEWCRARAPPRKASRRRRRR